MAPANRGTEVALSHTTPPRRAEPEPDVRRKATDIEDLIAFRQRLNALAMRLSGANADLSRTGDEELARRGLASEGHLLAEVRAALARLDAGTFGLCVWCGRSVGLVRLAAAPYARDCIHCTGAPADASV